MRGGTVPFKFVIGDALKSLANAADGAKDSVEIALPFITVRVRPSSLEKELAAQIVVRALDRRVLSASECCDGCVNEALKSLQELRGDLVNKRVDLTGVSAGPLSAMLEFMLVAIRQFLTFEQMLSKRTGADGSGDGSSHRSTDILQSYFDALEALRGHLSRSLSQVAVIAGISLPTDGLIAGYQGRWPLDGYEPVDVSAIGIDLL
jgi:hypothetical protein